MHSSVAIIGGGLSGLMLALHLQEKGIDYQLYESRSRYGGRIKSLKTGTSGIDLGPSWFWPGQYRMEKLTQSLSLGVFEQYSIGELLYEDERAQVHRGMGHASMQGSYRIEGGVSALIEKLRQSLPNEKLHTNTHVDKIEQSGQLHFSNGKQHSADYIVLAIPPRVIADLTFSPQLDKEKLNALENIPTWMGGQAKFVATYDTPFWRQEGLSGDAISRRGPMIEIHDASSITGTPAALFGFVGIPASARINHQEEIKQASLHQLSRLFGEQALTPISYQLQDWATEPQSASNLDLQPLYHHPEYGLPTTLSSVWEEKILLGATEFTNDCGGYMEGALARAEELSLLLTQKLINKHIKN
ncbi:flavin monoamine oxidase family protein [Marinomonas sp. 2405UD68-3]|uniref:flavin monoamine oxidase family protein n=1 Tax=Marinomonas sp. 2405UD68-3 TaxID=3391835 RepID=UPI0039C9304E